MTKLIKNALVQSKEGFTKQDILIDNKKILNIKDEIRVKKDYVVCDAKNSYLLPGLIDLNVRLANNMLSKKNLDKLATSAKRGGFTSVVITSDFEPRLDSSTLLDFLKTSFDKSEIHLGVSVPLTDKQNDKLNDIAILLNDGAVAIYSNSNINLNLLKRGFQYAKMKKKPFFCFCYEPNLNDQGLMNEGDISFKLGLSGISKSSETVEVAKMTELSFDFDLQVIFQTISTKRSLDIINLAKVTSKNLYSEVSIHHLLKNDGSCDGFNTYAKILPPLRDGQERIKLLKELKKGTIDLLTSAHSPKSVLYKDVAFWDAHFGIGGVEEFFKLAYTFLVKKEGLSMQRLIEMCSTNPAKVLNLYKKGKIKVGYDCDMFLFNPKKTSIVDNDTSLYNKSKLYGEVEQVFIAQ